MKVQIVRMAYRRWERSEIGNWLAKTAILPMTNVDLSTARFNIGMIDHNDIVTVRNIAVMNAKQYNVDVLVMCDDDMAPSMQFLPAALKHLAINPASVIGSPACSARPERLVNVSVKHEGKLFKVSRASAAKKTGIEKVHCMGTGLIAIGMKSLEMLKPPYFDRVYNEDKTAILVTEDMYFTGNLTDAGGDTFVDWDHWAGHCKEEVLGKPEEGDL